MIRVLVARQSWGILWDAQGNVRQGLQASIDTPVYAAETGLVTISSSLYVTNARGELPGWVATGSYNQVDDVVGGSAPYRVEAASDSNVRKSYSAPIIDDTANLTAYIVANDDIQLRSGTYSVSALDFTGLSNKRLLGTGQGTTLIVTGTTGAGLQFANASFCIVADMLIRQGAQRTAGQLIYLDTAGGSCQRNRFEHLRIASPYLGIELHDCTTTVIDDIQFLDFNPAWPVAALISLSGATTSTTLDRLRGGTAAAVSVAMINIAGATVDTVQGSRWDLLNLGGSGCKGLQISNGQWIKLSNISLECGTATNCDALDVSGGRAITLTGAHLLGYKGAVLSGGKQVTIQGGEIIQTRRDGVVLSGGSGHKILGVDMLDVSQEANGYIGVIVSAGVSDFTVAGCDIGERIFGSASINSGVFVSAGASDRYVIEGNRVRNYTSAPVTDNGTGTHKAVADNVGV